MQKGPNIIEQRKICFVAQDVTYKEGVLDVSKNCVFRNNVINLSQLDDV